MTAPLLNLPIFAPAATAGGQPASGAVGGFEALMAAFFATGEAETGVAAPAQDEKTGEVAPTGSETASSAAPATVDAQTLAALLAVTPQAAPAAVAPAADSPEAAQGATGGPAPTFAPLLAAQEIASAPAAAADAAETAPLPDEATPAVTPVPGADVQPEAVATPKTDKPEGAGVEKPLPPGLEKPREGQVTPAAEHAQAKGAPPAHAAAVQTPAAPPPAPVDSAVDPIVQAEAAATEVGPETEPLEEHGSNRPAKAEPGRRNAAAGATAPLSTPAAPTQDDAAVNGPAPSASHAGEPAVAVEGDKLAAAPREAKPEAADSPENEAPNATAAAHQAARPAGEPALPVRSTPETVATLTAQIVKKLEGRSTKFDVELNPAGLGKVNVAIEISAQGRMTAALSFETPQAAAELRSRANELQKALEQAGFDMSGGALSFDVAGDRGQGRGDLYQQQQQHHEGGASRGRAFHALLETADGAAEAAAAAALHLQRRSSTGVDVRV